jgi:TetR/AcrR family acrAB operon transcriptional repressor
MYVSNYTDKEASLMRKTKEEAQVTREQVLQAALRVFRRKGYAATLEEIAQEAGFTRGAIYNHFEGKAQLYQLLIQQGFLRLNEAFEKAIGTGGTIEERIRNLLISPLAFLEEDDLAQGVIELTLFKSEVSVPLTSGLAFKQQGTQVLIERIVQIFDEGIMLGLLRADIDKQVVALALLATINGAILLWFQSEKPFSLKALASTLADTYLYGIASSA